MIKKTNINSKPISDFINKYNNVCVLVAHPDDETIFCGGLMLSFPEINWTVATVTMQHPRLRRPEFDNSINKLKEFGVNIINSTTLGFLSKNKILNKRDIPKWEKAIPEFISKVQPDLIITHNRGGDYGHRHHKIISRIINETSSNVLEFFYPGDRIIPEMHKLTNIYELKLSAKVLKQKNYIMENCYPSQMHIWKNWKIVFMTRMGNMKNFYFEQGIEMFTSKN